MDIKNRFKMDEIRKFFSNTSFVTRPMGRDLIVKSISSMNKKKQVHGMRSLVSRMQCGEDMSDLYSDIIKVIDTRDVEFKRLLNFYLVRYTRGWPAKQLICINTFLKDFGDETCGIRHCAIEDSGLLGDGAIIKNYVNAMRTHGSSDSAETRCKVAESLRNYFAADPKLFLDEGLCEVLRSLASDPDPDVCACAIGSIRTIERDTRILSGAEISKLLSNYTSSGNTEALAGLLGLMRNRAEDIVCTSSLSSLLDSPDLHMFYLASSLIISMDASYKQTVFDRLGGFLDCKDEELYFVLGYAESLIADVHYENSCFVIYHDDKKYNKVRKLSLLFRRLDDVSIPEIRRQCRDSELTGVILKQALRADYLMEELFCNGSQEEIILTLYDTEPISDRWSAAIRLFLYNARDVMEKRKYIYLSGRYSREIPSEIDNIQGQNIPSLINELIRFYMNLHRRGLMDQEAMLKHLGTLQKSYLAKDRIKMVVNGIKMHGMRLFNTFCNIKGASNSNEHEETSSLKTSITPTSANVLNIRPYGFDQSECNITGSLDHAGCMEGQGNPSNTDPIFDNELCDSEMFSGQQSTAFLREEENVWLRFAESQMNERHEARGIKCAKLIDTSGLKGVLGIVDYDVVLQVDILELPLTIRYEYRKQMYSREIGSERVIILSKVCPSAVNSKFILSIGRSVYELSLDVENFMYPLRCSRDELENEFRNIKNRIVLESFDAGMAYAIDDTSLAFSVFSSNFYGKLLDDKVVLKGTKDGLSLFQTR